jgi:hypothetical protein
MSVLIILKARVSSLTSGLEQIDKKPRAIVRVVGAPVFSNDLQIINEIGLVLDQHLVITISTEDSDA